MSEKYMDEQKEEFNKFVVLGGPHPTTNPEFFLEAGAADICAQGEGIDLEGNLSSVIDHFAARVPRERPEASKS